MEGPSIVILKELVKAFKHKKIIKVSGNAKIDLQRLEGQKILDFKSWGKHFLICFPGFTLRIHFLMFGSYRINEKKNAVPRLSLQFSKGVLNFYSCSIKFIEEDLDNVYDWEADVMSGNWNPAKALRKLRSLPEEMVCDVLLNQEIFAGAGNIIKNEVLFRIFLHPEATLGNLKTARRKELVETARAYSLEFYKWKKLFQLKKHWQIYRKKTCPRCHIPVVMKHTGYGKRISFFCFNCQLLS